MIDQKIICRFFVSYPETVRSVLFEAGLKDRLKNQQKIIIKPNLVNLQPPPTTTPVEIVQIVYEFCRINSKAEIVVAEGSGGCDTDKAYQQLGYTDWAKQVGVRLTDLNQEERIEVRNEKAQVLKKVKLPRILFDSFIISLPVLKEHSQAKLSCAMKNIVGVYLNSNAIIKTIGWYYKSELHLRGLSGAIVDLNHYLKSDFILVDASVSNRGHEAECHPANPKIGQIVAGFDAKEVDRYCAGLLGLDWQKIKYLR